MLNRLPKQVPYWISIENLTSSFSHQNTCSAHRHLVLSMFSWVSFKNALFRMKLTSSSRSTSLYAWTSVLGSTDPQSASCDSLWSKRIVHSLDSCVDQGTHFSGLQEELIVWGKELYHLGLWPFLERRLAGRGRIITDGGEVAGGAGGGELRLLPPRQVHKVMLVSLELAKASVTAASQPSSPIVPPLTPSPFQGPSKGSTPH